MSQPVFRFAPSPTGFLHLGHAYAALYNQKICNAYNGTMLLRMENTDLTRCTGEFEAAIVDDLEWMGFKWQGDIRRQSEHFPYYASMMEKLIRQNLVYPALMTRGQIRNAILQLEQAGKQWPRDPDSAPFYPGEERDLDIAAQKEIITGDAEYSLRLDMNRALHWLRDHQLLDMEWQEFGGDSIAPKQVNCRPELWGDVVLGRKYIPARYHLACVIDDAVQGVTHVVRGMDIYPATSIHRLLQEILSYAAPQYCHHQLIVDESGRKLSKRQGGDSIQAMRKAGMSASDLYDIIGISP